MKEPSWVSLFQSAHESQLLEYLREEPLPQPNNDRDPLAIAILRNLPRVVVALLSHGAKVEANQLGWVRSVEVAEALSAKAEWSVQSLGSALRSAIERDDSSMTDWLLARDATITASQLFRFVTEQARALPPLVVERMHSEERSELFELAAEYGNLALATQLMPHVDVSSTAALQRAAANNHVDVLQALIRSGDDLDRLCPDGDAALVMASFEGAIDAVRVLLEFGANPNVRNVHGQSALDGAVACEHVELRQLLLAAGAESMARPRTLS